MKQKRHSTEEIIRIVREVDNGRGMEEMCREHNIAVTSYYRWKKKYGGMELQDARRYRELKTMLADSLLKIRMLEEVNAKSGRPSVQAPGRGASGIPRAMLGTGSLSLPWTASLERQVSGEGAERLVKAVA